MLQFVDFMLFHKVLTTNNDMIDLFLSKDTYSHYLFDILVFRLIKIILLSEMVQMFMWNIVSALHK